MSEVKVSSRPPISATVYEILRRNVGLPVNIDDIRKETGFSKGQIQAAIAALRNRNNLDVESIIAGHVYRARSLASTATPEPAERTKRLFEEIGIARDGRIIIQAAEGGLYEAKEL